MKEVAALNSTLLHPRTLARLSFLIRRNFSEAFRPRSGPTNPRVGHYTSS